MDCFNCFLDLYGQLAMSESQLHARSIFEGGILASISGGFFPSALPTPCFVLMSFSCLELLLPFLSLYSCVSM